MKITSLLISTLFTSTIYGASVSPQEIDFWLETKQKNTIPYYKLYLQTYPNGNFTSQANQSMQELDPSKKTSKEVDYFEYGKFSDDDTFYTEDEVEEKTSTNYRTSSLGFGIGFTGIELWLHKDYLDYGLAAQLTTLAENGFAANANLFVNIHLNKKDSGFYFPITLGRAFYYEKSTAGYDSNGNPNPTGYTYGGTYTGTGEYDANGNQVIYPASTFDYNSDGEYVDSDGYAKTSSYTVGTGVGYRFGSDILYLDFSLRVAVPTFALYPNALVGLKFN